MKGKARKPALTDGQRRARRDLRQLVDDYPKQIAIVHDTGLDDAGFLRITVRLPTSDLNRAPNGLPVSEGHEDIVVCIPSSFPWHPPSAFVTHDRFVGQPHVLQGRRLCIYLDPAREWHPEHGIRGFLNRLWDWLADGAAGKFDAAKALFHPVGGVLHRTPGTPTIVARMPLHPDGRTFLRARLVPRTANRIDLVDWDAPRATTDAALVIVLHAPLPWGAGVTLRGMLQQLGLASYPRPDDVAFMLAQTAKRNAPGTPLYMVLAVPNPGPAAGHHLIAGRLPAPLADSLREVASRHGLMSQINWKAILPDPPIEWCSMSDERPEVNTRRDAGRPISRFAGKAVEVWGCGGLGSWIAEFIARAGAARLVLRDPGEVHGGLLVRQNYTESDIGGNKAHQLAQRLRAIAEHLDVIGVPEAVPSGLGELLPDCDVIVDATVDTAVAHYLDLVANRLGTASRPLLAHVATDLRTATLGLLAVSAPGLELGPAAVDRQAGSAVLRDAALERFHVFWQEPVSGDELIPTRGCSVPTFHGAAADLAGVAASLVSLLASHLGTGVSGTHLVALPHAPGSGPNHSFLPVHALGGSSLFR